MAILRAAIPGVQISFASEYPRWCFAHAERPAKMTTVQKLCSLTHRGKPAEQPGMGNALDIASVTQCDLVVFSGMAICKEFVDVNGPTVLALAKRGVPVLLLGTGALLYSEEERTTYADFLSKVKPIGFISRDEPSHQVYAKFAETSFCGIDCAFFLPEAYTPFSLTLPPFVVANFDHEPEPKLDLQGRLLIPSHHECWGPTKAHWTPHSNTLISDIPHDYLTLYANAEEVHSDRVHACIATLTYGRRARLYASTPRSALFKAVGAENIGDNLVQLDMQSLATKKQAQVEFVRTLVAKRFQISGNHQA